MQKIHSGGTDGNRYFWNIATDKTAGEYRSRCSTVAAVRKVLTKHGHAVKSVKPTKA